MLQNNKTRSDARKLAAPSIVSGADSLQFFVSFVRRQFPVIAFVAVLTILLGIVYIITARPSFTAQAQLLIDAQKVRMFQQQPLIGDLPIDAAQVESQVEVLKSENIAVSVIKNLHLNENPEFVSGRAGLLGTLFNFLFKPFFSDQAPSEFEINRAAVHAFQDGLTIKRIGLSYVIQVNFRSFDPERAAEIANAVAEAYIDDQLEAKYQATRRASVWLQDRIKELREQVSTAERAVVDFKTQNNIVSTGGTDKRLVGEQQVAELNSQLVIARANTAEAKARLDRIAAVLNADSPNASVDATVADTLKSEVVTKLRSRYLDLAARESEWSTKYGHDHLATVNLRNQMREIRSSIFDELKRLGETYKSDYEIAKQREVGVMKELAQAVSQSQSTNKSQIALRELESTAQTYKTLYDNFLQRYMESVQQQSFPITEARLISSASRPLSKSHPQTILTLVIAGFGGIILGFGVGLLRDLSDRVFRTSEQVETILETDCISLVPLLTGDEAGETTFDPEAEQHAKGRKNIARSLFTHLAEATGRNALVSDLRGTVKSTRRIVDVFATSLSGSQPTSRPPAAGKGTQSDSRTIVRHDDLVWTVVDKPFSRYTEAMRSIKLVLDLDQVNKSSRVI
jgi:polysaccharide biosynthesis transport protein